MRRIVLLLASWLENLSAKDEQGAAIPYKSVMVPASSNFTSLAPSSEDTCKLAVLAVSSVHPEMSKDAKMQKQ